MSVALVACSMDNQSSVDASSNVESSQQTEIKSQLCSNEWFAKVDSQVKTGDGQGHGPDLGSSEWRSVVEFKLGIRGNVELPVRDSELWCDYINSNFIK